MASEEVVCVQTKTASNLIRVNASLFRFVVSFLPTSLNAVVHQVGEIRSGRRNRADMAFATLICFMAGGGIHAGDIKGRRRTIKVTEALHRLACQMKSDYRLRTQPQMTAAFLEG